MSKLRRYFKLPAELGDGQHSEIIDADPRGVEILLERVRSWALEFGAADYGLPEQLTIETVDMTPEHVASLPEI